MTQNYDTPDQGQTGSSTSDGSGGTTGGTGGGTGGGGSGPPSAPPPDWSTLLQSIGLPQAIIDELNTIWTQAMAGGGDVNTATELAMAYIRGTDWYAKNFAYIQSGINNGLFSGDNREQDYRDYVAKVNELYQQYYGRNATAAELQNYIVNDHDTSYVENSLQGKSIDGTLSDPLKLVFTAAELLAYSNEQAGIDSALGQKISQEVDMYGRMTLLYQNFYGRDITRAELDADLTGGKTPEEIAQEFSSTDAYNAIAPWMKALFTPAELQSIALDAAGGTVADGEQLRSMMDLASQLNDVYQSFGGTLTRDELNYAYTNGISPSRIQNLLQSGVWPGSLPQSTRDLFTPEEIAQAAQEATGATQTSQGARLLQLIQSSGSYLSSAQQYGQQLSRTNLETMFDQNVTPGQYQGHLQGQAYGQTYKNPLELATAAGGEGDQSHLTDDQLTSLGEEQTGLDTPQGQRLKAAFDQAQQRMQGAFQGVLARNSDWLSSMGRKDVKTEQQDVGA